MAEAVSASKILSQLEEYSSTGALNSCPQSTRMQHYRVMPHPPASPRTLVASSTRPKSSTPHSNQQTQFSGPLFQATDKSPLITGSHSTSPGKPDRPKTCMPSALKGSANTTKPSGKTGFGKSQRGAGTVNPPKIQLKRPATVVTTNPTVWMDSKRKIPRRPQTSDNYMYSSRKKQGAQNSRTTVTLDKLDIWAFNEGAEITSVSFSIESTTNHTSRFQCDDTDVIMRRGNTLNVTLTTTFPVNYECQVILTFIPVFRPQDRFAHFKTEKNVKTMKKGISLGVPIPPNFSVGKYNAHVSMTKRNGKDVVTHFHPKSIVVLFNSWEPLDEVYVENDQHREAYVLDDVGIIWRGVDSYKTPLYWEYGQYEEHCLDVALYLLRELNSEECKSAVQVCRELMAQLNSCDSQGLLLESNGGRGTGSHMGGMHPSRWTSSTSIIAKFYRSRNAVRYGQCWVFAGVAVTLLRCLGIAARPITCYNAAHYCQKLGQVERFFAPSGDMLNSLNRDQLWVYHVWVEAWIRRDDLPEGYGGWQVLDPTSKGRQGGRYRVGPASVRAIKEGMSGKKWLYNNEFVRAEVVSKVKYLRSLSQYSYGSSTKLLNIAQVNKNEVGTAIVTHSFKNTDNEPLDVTESYKAMQSITNNGVDKSHVFPPPTNDCSFEVRHNEGVALGDNLDLNIVVGNKGATLRTIDGKVAGFSILYTGEPMCSFMSMEFCGIISPGQSASVNIPLDAKRYLRAIQEQCILQFFIVIKARENKQLFLKVHNVQLRVPELRISCARQVCLGSVLRVKISFTNILQTTLSRMLFLLQAQSLCPSRELSYKKLVLPGDSASVECTLYPSEIGQFTLLASLCCDQLTDIRGHTKAAETAVLGEGRLAQGGNPAADPRLMRRVIAEDPKWNLETILPLKDVIIKFIVDNFHKHPILDELDDYHREKVLGQLPTTVPLSTTAPLIADEKYWKRCSKARWDLCVIADHAYSWKTLFFERHVQEAVEKFVPGQSSLEELEELLKLSCMFVNTLVVRQLLPPIHDNPMVPDDDDADTGTEDLSTHANNDHLDCSVLLKNLTQLKQLQLTYAVRNCGMNFQWSFFEFTNTDCHNVGVAIKATPTLEVFRLRESRVDDDQTRVLVLHLLDHPALRLLDMSHNCLGPKAGRALGKLLNDHSPQLTVLDLSDNKLETEAGSALGHALQKNSVLTQLNISMNWLGDLGVQPLLKALCKNTTLQTLDISSNNIGEPSAPALLEMLMVNRSLTSLSVTGNKLGDGGGKLLLEIVGENKTLLHFDIRLTGISQQSEYIIENAIKENNENAASSIETTPISTP